MELQEQIKKNKLENKDTLDVKDYDEFAEKELEALELDRREQSGE
jgi:hypothetical protein